MKVLVSGASGFVGGTLKAVLEDRGDEVVPLVRRRESPGIFWDPISGEINRSQLDGFDAVVHLAGEGIADRRWTKDQKEKILQSRVKGTALLVKTLSGLSHPPHVLVSASASGYYGSSVWEPADESAPAGTGFLAEVCRAWEFALRNAPLPQTRVVVPRFGLILGKGGILSKLVPPFRLGLGGKLGNGAQWMSWVSLRDAVRSIVFAIDRDEVSGPLNVVSPAPVTNAEFTRALGAALRRPAVFTVPAAALRLALGEMADETALGSSRLLPKKLTGHGFVFEDAEISSCLSRILRRDAAEEHQSARSAA